MPEVKPFRTYAEQVALLQSRGMFIEDHARAEHQLATLNYYRLSGYWHTMRRIDPGTKASLDGFREGASFDLVVNLYRFDERLRNAIFADLARVELALRALIGHRLGAIDPLIHLDTAKLGPPAQQSDRNNPTMTVHKVWLRKYNSALKTSKEDFVKHHQSCYAGKLPIWAAVEIMDWGMLSHLYRMAPRQARDKVASELQLRAPQLESWLRSLNILRNYAAHHARVFNRGFDIKPKLSQDPRLDSIRKVTNRAFGQLTLIRYLHRELGLSGPSQLPAVLGSFPHNELVPFDRLGAPYTWQDLPLWSAPAMLPTPAQSPLTRGHARN